MIICIEKKVKFLQKVIIGSYNTSTRVQITTIRKLSNNPVGGCEVILYFLLMRKQQKNWKANYIDGFIYEILVKQSSPKIKNILKQTFDNGVVLLQSQQNMDYQPLQDLLIHKCFLEADIWTHKKLCELSNLYESQRSWLYFTDVLSLPTTDLHTIDNLWRAHSLNKFGFSIQREIWLASNKNWNKMWQIIGWKINDVLCRYPKDFYWDVNGPVGHLPLFNQLYGVQPLLALLQHKAWEKY